MSATTKLKNGGPAFPTEPNSQPGVFLHHGMSLRDYFAAKAMQGSVARESVRDYQSLAGNAYRMADAMLAAREQQS